MYIRVKSSKDKRIESKLNPSGRLLLFWGRSVSITKKNDGTFEKKDALEGRTERKKRN